MTIAGKLFALASLFFVLAFIFAVASDTSSRNRHRVHVIIGWSSLALACSLTIAAILFVPTT